MRKLRALLIRFAEFFRRPSREQEFAAEMESHLHLHIEDNLGAGMKPERARREALMKLGGVEQVKESYREQKRLPLLETALQDLRFALRLLRKSPGFAIVAVLTLALGIGGNTAVFSVMNCILLRNLPLPHPEQLVYLQLPNGKPDRASNTGDDSTSFSEAVFEVLRKENAVFSDLMAYVPLSFNKVTVRMGELPEEAEGDMVSGNFFSGLGTSFARGRGFTIEDEKSRTQVVVLSYTYWTGRFARNPEVLGQTMYIKGLPFTIVGVTAPGFYGVEAGASTDFWIPLQERRELNAWGMPASSETLYGTAAWWCMPLIGRLQPNLSQSQALAMLDADFQSAAQIGLGTADQISAKSLRTPLAFESVQGIRGFRDQYAQPIKILMSMVGLVLLIACANVAMLLAARNSARQREFSMRLALGAGAQRLLRQLLAESLLLVFAGAALGWLFAMSATNALAAWTSVEIPFALDSNVLLFTLAVSLACSLVFGLAPLRAALRVPANPMLRTHNEASQRSKQSVWAGKVVIATQMALCLILLVGAGLLVRSLRNYETLPLGLRTDGLLVFGTTPRPTLTNSEKVLFYRRLLEHIRVLPGVESATVVSNRLGSGWSDNNVFAIDGVFPQGSFEQTGVRSNDVGPDFFHTMGIPLLQGRDILDSDGRDSPKVAVINETFVKRFFPQGNPLGHTIGGERPEHRSTVVGVVGDYKYTGVDETPLPMAFFPYTTTAVSDMQVELHTTGNPDALIPGVRTILRELDPNMAMQDPRTQREQFEATFWQARLFARLSLFFGLLAALLVATGLYGTLAYRVSRRTSEIGLRMALGAQRPEVLWMVLRESLLTTIAGACVGVPLAIAGTRLMTSMLFGVAPRDVLSFVWAFVGVLVVALLASVIPARRAASVDPIIALRYE